MNYRFIFLAAVILLLMPLGICQGPVYISPESDWGNPYPGLGSVYPSSTYPDGIISGTNEELPPESSGIKLYAGNLHSDHQSKELLLSQTPSSKLTKIIQKIEFDALWAPANGSTGLGITELDLSAMVAVPMPAPNSAVLITPKFTTDFFDAKKMPLKGSETFYSTGVDFRWVRPICKNKLAADIGFGVFYSGDFKATGSDTLRFPAHAIGIWDINPRTKILFGIIYTDKSGDFTWLPMAGVIWTPNDDVNVELMIPRLKIAQRIRWFGSRAGEEQSDWIYTAFEFGGSEWGFEYQTDPSITGKIDYQDLKLLLGYERRTRFGAVIGLELGYMFDRELDFVGRYKQKLSDSVFLRLRTSF